MRPSPRRGFGPALASALAATACFGDVVIEPDPEPDLSGSWRLTMSASPSSIYVPTQGTCQFDEVRLQLRRVATDAAVVDHRYEGEHQGGRMQCHGFDEITAEWTRLGDTTVVFPADTMSVDLLPCFGFQCGGPTVQVNLWGFYLGGAPLDDTFLSGQLLLIADDSTRLRGSWTARR